VAALLRGSQSSKQAVHGGDGLDFGCGRIAVAIERGEVAPGADPIAILNTVVGAVMFHMMFVQQPPGAFVESPIDLLLGSLRPP
jgi:hypothetical protein